ncbi:MAG: PTS sugar transporter subunit IIA [Candidatus Nanohaloarchaea archaeon]|nr:PTS sugar transporter subunit IIA [Candidatus Nanohaloarchaea archaeon]
MQVDFDEVMDEELVSLETDASSKEEVIEELIDIMDDAGRLEDRDEALEDVMEREKEISTGVGKGIAIPHAKTTAVEGPVVAFTRSTEGIDFDAPDDKPATLIFMLLFPEDSSKDYLKTLSTLSRGLVHEEVRNKLKEAESEEEVIDTLREVVERWSGE